MPCLSRGDRRRGEAGAGKYSLGVSVRLQGWIGSREYPTWVWMHVYSSL
jgi:hypothetical protein